MDKLRDMINPYLPSAPPPVPERQPSNSMYTNKLRQKLGLPERVVQVYDPYVESPFSATTAKGRSSFSTTPMAKSSASATPTAESPSSATPTTESAPRARSGECRREGRSSERSQSRVRAKVEPAGWATNHLSSQDRAELFGKIHEFMDHIPYAICGLAALIDHGFKGRRACTVTVLCREDSKDTVKGWAATRGCIFDKKVADSIGVKMGGGGAGAGAVEEVRRVKIKYMSNNGFDSLGTQTSRCSPARILTLSSQLEHITGAYLQQGPTPAADDKIVRNIVGDIFFCLRTAAETRRPLNMAELPSFLSRRFWQGGFMDTYADARVECQRAGIDVSAVLRRHNMSQEMREHDELLRKYLPPAPSPSGEQQQLLSKDGAVVDDDEKRLRPFDNMRGLGSSGSTLTSQPSLYTLRSRFSGSHLESDQLEPRRTPTATASTLARTRSQSAQRSVPAQPRLTARDWRLGHDMTAGQQRAGRSAEVRPRMTASDYRLSNDRVRGRGTPDDWL